MIQNTGILYRLLKLWCHDESTVYLQISNSGHKEIKHSVIIIYPVITLYSVIEKPPKTKHAL